MATPRWVVALAAFSLLLAVVTGVSQLYWVLFALDPETFRIGTDTNWIGVAWEGHVRAGDAAYGRPDAALLAGALLDGLVLGPLYAATGVGLLRRRAWVVPVGLLTAGMLLYGVLAYLLRVLLGGAPTVTDLGLVLAGNLPYLGYPVVLAWSLVRWPGAIVRPGAAGSPAAIGSPASAA